MNEEVIKCGKVAVVEQLQKLVCRCWEEGSVSQDMRDANIVAIYKNKGDQHNKDGRIQGVLTQSSMKYFT